MKTTPEKMCRGDTSKKKKTKQNKTKPKKKNPYTMVPCIFVIKEAKKSFILYGQKKCVDTHA